MTERLMVLGTGSGVGKSLLVTGICRWLSDRDVDVAPFKAQNMSNHAMVAEEDGEIAASQAIQARAARQAPSVHQNPLLLKPTADTESELVVRGEPRDRMNWTSYRDRRDQLWPVVKDSLDHLLTQHEAVVMEGAGSPSEPNLKPYDLVNLPVAKEAAAPVILVGDISRGGVFAWLTGTLDWMTPSERDRVRGVVINRFRGNPDLLDPAIEQFEERHGIPVLGVVPECEDLRVPEEDGLDIEGVVSESDRKDALRIVVLNTPRAANLTDVQPLAEAPDVRLEIQSRDRTNEPADLYVLPGSKHTVGDLKWLRDQDWEERLHDRHRSGSSVLGICGGYQMMGEVIEDPDGLEADVGSVRGLGWFPMTVRFDSPKIQRRTSGTLGEEEMTWSGYEIRYGRNHRQNGSKPWIRDGSGAPLGDRGERLWGTSVHGLFRDPPVRRWFLDRIREERGLEPLGRVQNASSAISEWTDWLSDHLDLRTIRSIMADQREAIHS